MAEKTLIANVRPDPDDPEILVVSSPVVGVADHPPRVGAFVNRFDQVVTIKVLGERHVLRMPRDVEGRIVEGFLPNGLAPVAYNSPLIRIDPRVSAGQASSDRSGTAAGADEEASAGVVVVSSPTVGVFYRRPSPDSPPFAESGTTVTPGTVLGLVEVMKCFNQITYGGPGLPEKGEVVKILAEDNSEVEFGQPLFWVKPVE